MLRRRRILKKKIKISRRRKVHVNQAKRRKSPSVRRNSNNIFQSQTMTTERICGKPLYIF